LVRLMMGARCIRGDFVMNCIKFVMAAASNLLVLIHRSFMILSYCAIDFDWSFLTLVICVFLTWNSSPLRFGLRVGPSGTFFLILTVGYREWRNGHCGGTA
jgi:hypothetical protein